jgi:pilus assembly protein CpaC
VTDLSITSSGGQNFSFNVRVVCDLEPLAAKLKAVFPDANLRLAQLRENIIVGGEARDQAQVSRIMQMTNGYLRSVLGGPAPTGAGSSAPGMSLFPGSQPPSASAPPLIRPNPNNPAMTPDAPSPEGLVSAETNPGSVSAATTIVPEVINLIRVPGSQQVLLKVRVAELNRSALRAIGANFLGVDPSTGAIVGTQLAGPVTAAGGLGSIGPPIIGGRKLTGTANTPTTVNTTVFGIFQDNSFEFTLNAMRTNTMLKVLAEPNLVALHGHLASFLAGGEFPVPVASAGAGGSVPTVNVQFKKFGVQLNFVPLILDGDVIRLSVAPVVSQIDNTISVTLVAGGSAVPGLSTRQAQTTVEMREGQTLAIAGLLQLQLNGTTERIPGLGDLPIIGPFFSNTSSQRIEKELVVLVTPYLIEAMHKDQVTPAPGDEVKDPNDLEVFLLNRIESRTGKDLRATTTWDDPMNLTRLLNLVPKYVNGPSGFSE